MYEYNAVLERVVDGDTVDLIVDLGFRVLTVQRFRLEGIDAPEVRGAEREDGLKAKDALHNMLYGEEIKVLSTKTGKFGRWLGRLFVDGQDINELMISEGYAKPYRK